MVVGGDLGGVVVFNVDGGTDFSTKGSAEDAIGVFGTHFILTEVVEVLCGLVRGFGLTMIERVVCVADGACGGLKFGKSVKGIVFAGEGGSLEKIAVEIVGKSAFFCLSELIKRVDAPSMIVRNDAVIERVVSVMMLGFRDELIERVIGKGFGILHEEIA